MSKNYDMIATVDIDIAQPIVDETSFDNLLIVGPLPKVAPAAAPAKVGAYSSLSEVIDAGWVVSGAGADPVGEAAQVAFAQSPTPSTIYIAPIQTTTVEETTTAESAVDTVTRALGTNGWYVVCPAGVDASEYEALAAFIETQEKMMVYTDLGFFALQGASVGAVYYRTLGIFGRETSDQTDAELPAANKYMNVAFAAKWLSFASGSETTAFKRLAAVYPSELTSTEMKALADANMNYFVTVGSANITVNGKVMAGEWADVIRFRDWLKNDMQSRVVNLFVLNPKVPYTDSGIALVQNAMLASLKSGQDAGGIAEEEFDADGNSIPGYQTSVPLAASLSAAQRASRKLVNCKFKARLAGAIHFAELKGSLTYEL